MIDIETTTETMRRKIADKRQIVQLIPILREVLKKYDGKVYNKRFNNAFAKAIEEKFGKQFYFNAGLSVSGEWLWITASISGHYSESVTLCGCALDDGKRIPGAKMIEAVNNSYASILKECTEIECNLDRMPEIIEQLSKLHMMQEQIKKSIPRSMCSEFRLDDVCKYGR